MPGAPDGHGRERRLRAALLGGVCLLAGGLGFAAAVAVGVQDEQPTQLVLDPAAGPPAVPVGRLAPPARPRPGADTDTDADADHTTRARPTRRPRRPVALVVPAIHLRAPVVSVGLAPDRTLRVPDDVAHAGWWKGGARPGDPGPAVIVGHVDSKSGPAVFYRVGLLRRGDAIRVIAADGRVVRFRVSRVAHYPKRRFPTRRVYGPTRGPALRLVTCSGRFDAGTGHYLDNTVVFATAVRR